MHGFSLLLQSCSRSRCHIIPRGLVRCLPGALSLIPLLLLSSDMEAQLRRLGWSDDMIKTLFTVGRPAVGEAVPDINVRYPYENPLAPLRTLDPQPPPPASPYAKPGRVQAPYPLSFDLRYLHHNSLCPLPKRCDLLSSSRQSEVPRRSHQIPTRGEIRRPAPDPHLRRIFRFIYFCC